MLKRNLISLCICMLSFFLLRGQETVSKIERDPPPEEMFDSLTLYRINHPKLYIDCEESYETKPLYLAHIGETSYYVDREKNIKLTPNFDWCDVFSEGLALVRQNRKFGFIDYNGKVVIPIVYDRGEKFKNGAALVIKNDKIGAIDKNNNFIIPLGDKKLLEFSNGLFKFFTKENEGYSYLNKKNEVVIDKKYQQAMGMKNGYELVSKDDYFDKNMIKWNIIDSSGLEISKTDFDFNFRFCDKERAFEGFRNGYCPIIDDTRHLNFLDWKGNLFFKSKSAYYNGDYFSEGFAAVTYIGYYGFKYIYIDSLNNRYFEDKKLEGAKAFIGGLAPVKKDDKWGYIDKNGAIIIPFEFSEAEPFSSGLARVQKDEKYGFIDKNGKLIIGYIYTYAETFKNGFARVTKKSNDFSSFLDLFGSYFIDTYGNCIFLCD